MNCYLVIVVAEPLGLRGSSVPVCDDSFDGGNTQELGNTTRRKPNAAGTMECYQEAMRAIEKERLNFLNRIDLVQPSFEEQHRLEVN